MSFAQARSGRRLHHRRRRLRRHRRQGADRGRPQGRRAGEGPVADQGELRRRRTRQRQPLQPLARPGPGPADGADHSRRAGHVRNCSARCRRWSAAALCTGRAGCPASPRRTSGCAPSPARCPAPRWPTGRSPTTTSSPTTPRSSGPSASPARPAPTRTRGRGVRATPARRCPQSRYAEKFHEGCAELGWNSFPTPQAALSRPFNGRPATVVSAFAQQHGDPTGPGRAR